MARATTATSPSSKTVVPLIKKWLLQRAARSRRRASAACPSMLSLGRDLAGLSLAENAHRPRFRDAQRGRHPRPAFQGRSRQGLVRVRRRGRQFRLALHARARPTSCSTICSARRPACPAPGAMRSAAWARSPRRWRAPAARPGSTSCSNTPVEEVIVDKGRAVGVVAGGKAWRAQAGRRRGQSQAAVRPAGPATARSSAEVAAADAQLEMRKRDLPDERRSVRAAQVHACCRRRAIT